MENNIFDIKGLTHFYNGQKALDIPSLQFKKGKVYSIIGPNGAGKTTLLNILAFLNNPSSGVLRYDGKEVSKADIQRLRMEVTLVHQTPYLFSTSVENNVVYGLKIRGISRDEIRERVVKGLQAVGLSGMGNKSARELSGGEAQRVALARAIVLRPKVLLLDEPSAHIDVGHIKSFEGIIKDLCQIHGTTVILTTHNLIQATLLSDQIVAMREGRVSEIGADTETHSY
ncbi:MAG: ATP-binding cassette domain-containing protein [Deltaproteobacteria bacterium]